MPNNSGGGQHTPGSGGGNPTPINPGVNVASSNLTPTSNADDISYYKFSQLVRGNCHMIISA